MSKCCANKILIAVAAIIAFANVGWAQEINVLPSPPLAFTFPCGNDPKLFVETYRVQENNKEWEGVFYMDRFRNVFSVRLQVILENPAELTLKNTLGNVITNDNQTFLISTFKIPPEIRRIEFRVKGLTVGFFPHLISLRFNDQVLCDNNDRDLSAPFLKKGLKCGKQLVGPYQGLIANSYDASPGSWPWHAAIFHMNEGTAVYKCGGTLINDNTVLTAAHCMFNDFGGALRESDYVINLGKHFLSVADENTKELKVSRAITHPSYRAASLSNDIGLLKLENRITFTKYIQPICLWDELPSQRVYFQTGYVVGWGHTEKGNMPSEVLREAQMPVVDSAQCLESNRAVFGQFLSVTNYCAGFKNGTSVCSGDSGSGMFIQVDGLWKIRGLVSVGTKLINGSGPSTCNAHEYVLFTDVLRYIDWIKERVDQ